MSDSSKSKSVKILARISADQIAILLDIIRSARLRQSSFVQSIYRERALNYAETLQFLSDIGWLKITQGQIELTPASELFRPRPTRSFLGEGSIIRAMTQTPGAYQKLLASYLGEFQTSGRKVICRPSAQSRVEHSDIRNLLMQFGMVSHQAKDDSYLLEDQAAHLYFWAKNYRGARACFQNDLSQSKTAATRIKLRKVRASFS